MQPFTQLLSITDLSSHTASRTQRFRAIMIGSLFLLLSLLILPYSHIQLPEVEPFLPAFIAVICFADTLTGYLLLRQFRVDGSFPLLVLSGVYFYTGWITIPHILAFPHVFTETGLLGAGSQTAVWLWVFWHAGFPAGIILYLLSFYVRGSSLVLIANRKKAVAGMLLTVLFVVIGLTIVSTVFHDQLPVIISNQGYQKIITSGIGPAIWILHLLSLGWLVMKGKMKSVLHIWLTIAVLASLLDVTVTLLGGSRYTLGWYMARVNSLLSAGIVLSTFVYEINRLYSLLAEQQQQYESLFKHHPDAVYAVDVERTIMNVNDAGIRLAGYSKGEIYGKESFSFFFPSYKEKSHDRFQQVLKGNGQNYEAEIIHKNGQRIPVNITSVPIVVQEQVIGIYSIVKDITLQKEAQEKLEQANKLLKDLSLKDGLTGVANRRHLDMFLTDHWKECMQHSHPLSFILLDIDEFKKYNDGYGHQQGDRCLQAIAAVLKEKTPLFGLAARYGGEEFCIILPNTDLLDAQLIAEQIRQHVQSLQIPHIYAARKIVTISTGVATLIPQSSSDASQLITRADQALYEAKNKGRNKVIAL